LSRWNVTFAFEGDPDHAHTTHALTVSTLDVFRVNGDASDMHHLRQTKRDLAVAAAA